MGPVALYLEAHYEQYFDGLAKLHYDATRSLRTLLDHISNCERVKNRWKAMQLKMGLLFANPFARTAWYIMHSSILYTFEMSARLRKSNGFRTVDIFYKDVPSLASGPTDDKMQKEQPYIAFRD